MADKIIDMKYAFEVEGIYILIFWSRIFILKDSFHQRYEHHLHGILTNMPKPKYK